MAIIREKRCNFAVCDYISKTTNNNIIVNSINTLSENSRYKLSILVENIESLNKFINDLNTIKEIKTIERLIK